MFFPPNLESRVRSWAQRFPLQDPLPPDIRPRRTMARHPELIKIMTNRRLGVWVSDEISRGAHLLVILNWIGQPGYAALRAERTSDPDLLAYEAAVGGAGSPVAADNRLISFTAVYVLRRGRASK